MEPSVARMMIQSSALETTKRIAVNGSGAS
jgi:hypothetical protein